MKKVKIIKCKAQKHADVSPSMLRGQICYFLLPEPQLRLHVCVQRLQLL